MDGRHSDKDGTLTMRVNYVRIQYCGHGVQQITNTVKHLSLYHITIPWHSYRVSVQNTLRYGDYVLADSLYPGLRSHATSRVTFAATDYPNRLCWCRLRKFVVKPVASSVASLTEGRRASATQHLQ